jgi:hypothetical protein
VSYLEHRLNDVERSPGMRLGRDPVDVLHPREEEPVMIGSMRAF